MDVINLEEAPAKRQRVEGGAIKPSPAAGKKQSTLFAAFRKPATPLSNSGQGPSPEDEELRDEWEPRLGESWYTALRAELKRPSMQQLLQKAEEARAKVRDVVFPPREYVFRAFVSTPLDSVRVVIVGQDPYHGRGQAMGLAFSVPRGMMIPPSLQNMLKEAGAWPATHGNLESWTSQGVFLLNTVLTVVEGQANSHKNLGWERFTDAAIRTIDRERSGVIFLLWGKDAQSKAKLVDSSRHTVLIAGHPSPLSYEKHFKGCDHFRKVNALLCERGEPEIVWRLS